MRITVTSISIGDYDKALKFYTEVLGFVQKRDIPLGGGARWITVVSPEEPNGTELLLEPNADYPAMKALKESLVKDGIPFTMFQVDDIQKEYDRPEKTGRDIHHGANEYGYNNYSNIGRYLWKPYPDLSNDWCLRYDG